MINLRGWGAGFRLFLLMVGCIVLYALSIKSVPAQSFCPMPSRPYEQVVNVLKDKYGESRRAVLGVGFGRSTIVELWTAPNSKTWTLVIRNGNCARQLGAGMSYQILDDILGTDS